MEHSARFDEITINLPEALGELESISAVVGIPEWWPTGARVAVAIAHEAGGDMNDPLVQCLHRDLAFRKFLTIRFNFAFAQAGTPASGDSPETLEKAYRAALSILGRDPSAAPSHLFLGGIGLGARVAARLATARLQIDGVFLLGYPLHPADKPEQVQAEDLYRIIPPLLFVQGTRDRRCQLDALRRCLARVGAPTTLRTIDDADHSLKSPGQVFEPIEATPKAEADSAESEGEQEDTESSDHPGSAISESVAVWMDNILQAS